MQDQVASLQAKGLAADYLASTRKESDRRTIYQQLDLLATSSSIGGHKSSSSSGANTNAPQGGSKPRGAAAAAAAVAAAAPGAASQRPLSLLYVTPELLQTEGFAARLRALHGARGAGGGSPIKLVAVDEAHCISQYVSLLHTPLVEPGEVHSCCWESGKAALLGSLAGLGWSIGQLVNLAILVVWPDTCWL